MAARAWSVSAASDEILFRNDTVSLSLLLNRGSRTLRIFDFRAGVAASKRTFVMSVARRENVERVFTVVEREEVGTWTRLGLLREGAIPGFYKRSDAYVLGGVLDPAAPDPTSRRARGSPMPVALAADTERAEATLRSARNLARKESDARACPVKLYEAQERDVQRAVAMATRAGSRLSLFEPFGRDAERITFVGKVRSSPVLLVSVEIQPCFDHAFVEWLSPPSTFQERAWFRAGLGQLCELLTQRNVVSVFAISPTADLSLASVFIGCGFRRTGLLARHMRIGSDRRDAFLWTRKNALAEDDPLQEQARAAARTQLTPRGRAVARPRSTTTQGAIVPTAGS